jgi:hypothetical protein
MTAENPPHYAAFDQWASSHGSWAIPLVGGGIASLGLGVWLFFLVPWFGHDGYWGTWAFYAAYGQASSFTAFGVGVVFLGSLALWQRRRSDQVPSPSGNQSRPEWVSTRRILRAFAWSSGFLSVICVVIGFLIVISDPSASDYWSFGLPTCVVLGLLSYAFFRMSRLAMDQALWNPSQ